jgi:hypothetical protein
MSVPCAFSKNVAAPAAQAGTLAPVSTVTAWDKGSQKTLNPYAIPMHK